MWFFSVFLGTVLAADVEPCDGFSPPPADPVDVDEACQSEPRVGSWDPVVEWQWSEEEVITAPMVLNLTDDNADGAIDTDDTPDIAFVSHPYYGWNGPGTLRVLSGDGSGEHLALPSPISGYAFSGGAGVALGDLEGDGSPDICLASTSVAVLCLEHDGTFKWAAGWAEERGWGYPSIGDMDGDGLAEVVLGSQVFDAYGSVLYAGGSTAYDANIAYGALSALVDMDGDGELEIVGGGAVMEMDGTILWADSGAEGVPGVGDFDGDGLPEVVRTGAGYITLNDDDGTLLWSTPLPGGGRGGPPTVADFDGDDEPEVGVAGAYYYSVIETDGSVRWSCPTNDTSSQVTGSSVFDFEGDGRAEVVYADEYNLFVLDGDRGCILMEESGHDSATIYEYPVIADVDGDESAEIVLGSARYRTSGDWAGITVLGSSDSSWVAARPVWNQHTYHITNVEDDGSIPAVEEPNWDRYNNFRAAGLSTGPSDWLADLGIEATGACHSECTGDRTIDVYATVSNRGLLAGTDAEVVFYYWGEDGQQVVSASQTITVESGDSTRVGPITLDEEGWGPSDLWVAVNPNDDIAECGDGAGQAQVLGPWPFPATDADGDGFDSIACGGDDCDDEDFEVHPGAGEVPYDGVDNDCDAATLDDDLDGDGHPLAEDCDDMDASRSPSAEELPENGIDDNCDGIADNCPTPEASDCGCSVSSPAVGWALLPLIGLLARRRRPLDGSRTGGA